MRISWLRAEEITAARVALSAAVAARGWDALFHPDFAAPPAPADLGLSAEAWARLSEHVARAERVSEVVRDHGLDAALTRFRGSGVAIEAATLAAAAQVADQLELALVTDVLACTIDEYLFYAPFLELLMSLGRADLGAAISEFERFVAAYRQAPSRGSGWHERVGAVRDGLADAYVTAGQLDAAERLFAERHGEDTGDVAVALSASRAFLAAGAVGHAVRWLAVGATRADQLGRREFASALRHKEASLRKRLS
ncbi:MAG: hypothetical protein KBG28_07640 [Kofleriaceae bacterium]|jgi:hypothetical protein|nr:hypothetical protein [Kofleriaceae bacterium]MBP6840595.1 hypothetical protein [Kofleriaceae bacterium]MBP9203815.1 hypothetical protein [Kofleriaceae bacterium]